MVVIKVTGLLVWILNSIAPSTYQDHVVYKNRQPVVYVEVMKGLYGMLIAALLWYKKIR